MPLRSACKFVLAATLALAFVAAPSAVILPAAQAQPGQGQGHAPNKPDGGSFPDLSGLRDLGKDFREGAGTLGRDFKEAAARLPADTANSIYSALNGWVWMLCLSLVFVGLAIGFLGLIQGIALIAGWVAKKDG